MIEVKNTELDALKMQLNQLNIKVDAILGQLTQNNAAPSYQPSTSPTDSDDPNTEVLPSKIIPQTKEEILNSKRSKDDILKQKQKGN